MIIAQVAGEDLCLRAQPPIRRAMYDPVAVALKGSAVRMFRLRMFAPLGMHTVHCPGAEQTSFARFDRERNGEPPQAKWISVIRAASFQFAILLRFWAKRH